MTQNERTSSSTAWSAEDLRQNPHLADDKADRVRSMFASIASSYDLNNRLHSFGRDQAWRRKTVKFTNAGPNDDVLDVACGTGDLTLAFAAAEVNAVTALDFTEEMLEIAREKSTGDDRKNTPTPTYVQGDAMALPFTADSFDIVSIAFGIRNVADPKCTLAEFKRVLRPGGRVAILEFSQPVNPLLRAGSRFYTNFIMPRTATLIARDRSGAYRYLPTSVNTFMDRGEMTSLLETCGFTHIQTHPMTFGVAVAYLGALPR